MDYKKAYKEALERAKKLYEKGTITESIGYIFPELKEERDELTWLTKYIEEEAYYLSIDIRDEEDRIKLKNLKRSLAWLEKQESVGEIVERCKTSWYNEGKIQGQIEGLSDDEKYQQGWHDALEKQGEHKADYSEEDERIRKELIEFVKSRGGFKQKYITWLEKQGEKKLADNKERLGVLNFIRKEACCGLAEANNALLKLIKALKEHPFPIMDKSYKLKIEWEEQKDISINEDVIEAADEWYKTVELKSSGWDNGIPYLLAEYHEAFKAGAEWLRENRK